MLQALFLAAAFAFAPAGLPKWHVSASRLDVASGNLATDFTIANDDRVNERFEVAAYSWSQSGGIDSRRLDLDDVLVFPRLLSLSPGERRRIRVGVLQADPAIESDYRISVEQLVDPLAGEGGIHFLLAYDLPLFIAPARPTSDARIAGIAMHGKNLSVVVRNDGNVHAFARVIDVRWRGTSTAYGRPYYVLPHDTMAFRFAMHRCGSGVVTVVPNADSRIPAASASLEVPCSRKRAASEGARIVATLRINRVRAGDVVMIRCPSDIYVRERDVRDVPFPRHPSTRTIDGDEYASLDSSGIAYRYDAVSLTLDLSYRIASARRIAIRMPSPSTYSNGASATIAYGGTLGRARPPVLGELVTVAMPGGRLRMGFAMARGAIYRTDLDAVFLEHGQNGEILFGDQTLTGGGTLPALPIFGVGMTEGTLARTSGERAPLERISGTLENPTTIRIEVDGKAPIELGIEPGSFSIDGVPMEARVVAVDEVTGQPVQVNVGRPLDSRLLAPAWREIGFAAGLPRTCLYACAVYRGFGIGGSLLVGDSLFLSSGPHAEYLDGRAGIGYDVVVADPNRALRFSAGLGPLDGVLAAYEQRLGPVSLGFGYSVNGSPAYDDDGLLVFVRRNVSAVFNATFRRVRFAYRLWKSRSFGNVRTCDLIEDVPFLHHTVQLDLRDEFSRRARARISLGILIPFFVRRWRDTTAFGATIGAHDGPAAAVSSEVNTPSGFAVAGGTSGEFRASYSSDAFEVSGTNAGTLAVSGAVAFLHGIHPVRETDGGYTVVEGEPGDLIVDGDGRVHALSTSGTAFPLESSDRPTGLTYAQRSVTLDDNVVLSASRVYPAPGAGALIFIDHTRLFAVIGIVADPRWRNGTIALANGVTSPIGSDGLFYFEELSSGNHPALISAANGSCTTTIVVPASKERQINVGRVSCGGASIGPSPIH